MKLSRLFISAILLVSFQFSLGQVPQGFTFQAIARDVSGNPITGQSLTVETGILSDTIINTYIWKETHPVTTNQFGLFTLIIGTGTKTGGSAGSFNAINWSAGPLFIRTRVLYQSIWRDMSAAKLWSVPYAMVADKALAVTGDPVMINGGAVYIMNNVGIGTDAPGTTKLAVVGDDSQSSDALFEVKRKDGNVIFAVYNHGVRVNVPVDTLTKAKKGGFAVGGFDDTKGVVHDYMVINPDSIRFYFDNAATTKAKKGGFAVGGFDDTKGAEQNYLLVNQDSVRVYIDDTLPVKAKKGGFAVGGFDDSKATGVQFLSVTGQSTRIQVKDTVQGFSVANLDTGTPTDFMKVNKVNYFIGHESGAKNTGGAYNSFLGYQTGYANNTGSRNAFFGYQAGYSNFSGSENLFLGFQSGYTNYDGTHNTFVGFRSGYLNKGGGKNTFIGSYAGENNTTGAGNTFLGIYAGQLNSIGSSNVFLGGDCGQANTSGNGNIFIGSAAGAKNKTGSDNILIGTKSGNKNESNNNIFIGTETGLNTVSGDLNVFVGYKAGRENINGFGNVYIGHEAGLASQAGRGNVFIGWNAGRNEEVWSKLYIDNSATSNPLIYGDFDTDHLTINGNFTLASTYMRMAGDPGTGAIPTNYFYQGAVGSNSKQYAFSVRDALWVTGPSWFDNSVRTSGFVDINVLSAGALSVSGAEALWYNGTYFSWGFGGSYNYFGDKVTIGNPGSSGYMLYVSGSAYSTGTWSSSDLKFKENIRSIDSPLSKVMAMNGVSYNWKTKEFWEKGFAEGRHYGVIAQEIEKVLPEAVSTDESGEKAVAYNELIPVLIEAIKQQQMIISEKETEIRSLEERVSRLEALMIKD